MRKIIHHLRNQSVEVRKYILYVLTTIFGFILLFLWIYSLGTSLADPDVKAKISNDLKPFSALKSNLVGGYESITDSQ